jgi:hypothetical protein
VTPVPGLKLCEHDEVSLQETGAYVFHRSTGLPKSSQKDKISHFRFTFRLTCGIPSPDEALKI